VGQIATLTLKSQSRRRADSIEEGDLIKRLDPPIFTARSSTRFGRGEVGYRTA